MGATVPLGLWDRLIAVTGQVLDVGQHREAVSGCLGSEVRDQGGSSSWPLQEGVFSARTGLGS